MSEGSSPAAVYDAYLDAVLRGDRHGAFAGVEAAQAAGMALGTLYMDVFQATLREVGRLWQEDALSVADEHLATAITQAAMARAYAAAQDDVGPSSRTLIAACVDTERHEVGLRMICDLLECEGWDALYLGAAVSRESLAALVRERRPDAIALSTALAGNLPRVRATVESIRVACPDDPPLILVGGRPFIADPELAAEVGADLTAADAPGAVQLLRARFPRPA